MVNRLSRGFLFGIVLFFSSAFIFSNDGSYEKIEGSQTGAAMPINNDAITMVDENIEITVDQVYYDTTWLGIMIRPAGVYGGRIVTKCTFTFKNEKGIQQNVLIGYPVTNPIQVIYMGTGNYTLRNVFKQPDISFFEARVRGDEVPFSYGTHESNPALPAVGPYRGVYLFSVSFKPNETVIINNTIIQYINWNPGIPEFQYILTTGTTWKRPIGHSRITISFPEIPKEILDFNSTDYTPTTVHDSIFTYDFTNFSPAKDLHFQFNLTVSHSADLGSAFRRYYAAKAFKAIKLIDDVMSHNRDFTLKEAHLDEDFLRRMYFDCGNYYHAQGIYKDAQDMFKKALYYSSPFMDWMKKRNSVDTSNYRVYLSAASEWKTATGIINDTGYKLLSDVDLTAPGFFSAYNLVCASARLGDIDLINLELALIFGYPKKDYAWIRKDPDLDVVRALAPTQFEALLKKYETSK